MPYADIPSKIKNKIKPSCFGSVIFLFMFCFLQQNKNWTFYMFICIVHIKKIDVKIVHLLFPQNTTQIEMIPFLNQINLFFTNKVNLGHQSNLNKYLLQFFKIMLYLGCINFLFNRDIWIASEFSSWAFYSYYFLFPLKCKKLSFSTFSTLITKTLVLYLVTYLWAGWMFNQLLFVNKFVSSV